MMNFEHETRYKYLDRRPGVKIFLLCVLLITGLGLGLGTYAAAKLQQPFIEDAPNQLVDIPRGTTSRGVAHILAEKKIISNSRVFLYYLWIKGAREKIQAGQYELSANHTIPELVERLTKGQVVPNEVRVRIGEGWNLDRIAQAIEDAELGTAEDFFALVGTTPSNGGRAAQADIIARYNFLNGLPEGSSLEGYIFPDTYIISRTGGAEELVHKTLQNFERKISSELLEKAKTQNRTLHEIITMASLIEGEVGRNASGMLTTTDVQEIADERALVSGVFWNRLELGMALESDATVSYATGKPRRQSTFEDLEIDSPYNTYKYAGLMPGPINSPSLEAIEAALNPTETDYLFFLSDEAGKAYFGRTLQEHNANRARYLD